nr:MAG TPA: Proliferating cell nuclear antigen, PCNA-associated, p15, p15PAF, PAF15, crystal.9A [Caudoviricetes sp.]
MCGRRNGQSGKYRVRGGNRTCQYRPTPGFQPVNQ